MIPKPCILTSYRSKEKSSAGKDLVCGGNWSIDKNWGRSCQQDRRQVSCNLPFDCPIDIRVSTGSSAIDPRPVRILTRKAYSPFVASDRQTKRPLLRESEKSVTVRHFDQISRSIDDVFNLLGSSDDALKYFFDKMAGWEKVPDAESTEDFSHPRTPEHGGAVAVRFRQILQHRKELLDVRVEDFDGFVEKCEHGFAFVTLTTCRGDELRLQFPAQELLQKDIAERTYFRCQAIEQSGTVRFRFCNDPLVSWQINDQEHSLRELRELFSGEEWEED